MYSYQHSISSISCIAIFLSIHLTQASAFQLAHPNRINRRSTSIRSISNDNHIEFASRANQPVPRFTTCLSYKNKEYNDDAEETDPKQLRTKEAATVETTEATIGSNEAPAPVVSKAAAPKSSRVSRVVSSTGTKNVHTIISMDELKACMDQNKDRVVIVRFFSHWCKVRKAHCIVKLVSAIHGIYMPEASCRKGEVVHHCLAIFSHACVFLLKL